MRGPMTIWQLVSKQKKDMFFYFIFVVILQGDNTWLACDVFLPRKTNKMERNVCCRSIRAQQQGHHGAADVKSEQAVFGGAVLLAPLVGETD